MTFLNLITPLNIATERDKFLASDGYSPQFEYNWSEEAIAACKAARPELTELADALISQDPAAIEAVAAAYFDVKYRPADLAFAHSLVQEIPAESNGTAEELAAIMVIKLRDLGIDYDVDIVDRHGFQCRPDHQAHIVHVSKHLHLQFYPTESVVNHELVHIIRAVNGRANGIKRNWRCLPTDEGLACLVQDKLLKTPSPSAFQNALEYLASHVAVRAGFREVYQFFIDHGCDAENAWLRSIRQKFGIRNTAQPGSVMKSGMYFYHERLLSELDLDILVRLFVGKIPLDDLEQYGSYEGVVPENAIRTLLESSDMSVRRDHTVVMH